MKTVQSIGVAILVFAFILTAMYACPRYNVYRATKRGEAALREAEYNRRVAIVEAEAKRQSAKALSEADTIRATGISRANQIIGQSLTGSYLQWFWTESLKESQNKEQVIYVPSGNFGMPVMEAGRFNNNKTIENADRN